MQVIHIIAMWHWCKLTYIINFNAGILHAIVKSLCLFLKIFLIILYSTGLKGIV